MSNRFTIYPLRTFYTPGFDPTPLLRIATCNHSVCCSKTLHFLILPSHHYLPHLFFSSPVNYLYIALTLTCKLWAAMLSVYLLLLPDPHPYLSPLVNRVHGMYRPQQELVVLYQRFLFTLVPTTPYKHTPISYNFALAVNKISSNLDVLH